MTWHRGLAVLSMREIAKGKEKKDRVYDEYELDEGPTGLKGYADGTRQTQGYRYYR
jgi:hypothetical protein